ncbi:MAG TPA: hypothetical protein VJ600_09825 [Holophagaceae bacterium]|nr:hypothetical protein [Holophagaceae bacterium]
MTRAESERRKHWKPTQIERRGAQRSELGGLRAPDTGESPPEPYMHPARLRPSDLEDPHGFRERLVAWLMKQH